MIPAKAGTRFSAAGAAAGWIPAYAGIAFGKAWEQSMRAETQAVVDDIRKSLALLRRHL
jgi:hypothetical protein